MKMPWGPNRSCTSRSWSGTSRNLTVTVTVTVVRSPSVTVSGGADEVSGDSSTAPSARNANSTDGYSSTIWRRRAGTKCAPGSSDLSVARPLTSNSPRLPEGTRTNDDRMTAQINRTEHRQHQDEQDDPRDRTHGQIFAATERRRII